MEIKIVRKIDEVGRLVIPKDVRKTLDLQGGSEVEIMVKNDTVVLKKAKEKR